MVDSFTLPTGAQLRAARGLLNLSVTQLSEMTGLALNTIKRAEATSEAVPINEANARLLVRTLEGLGVTFLEATEASGAGVRFSSPLPPEQLAKRRNADRTDK